MTVFTEENDVDAIKKNVWLFGGQESNPPLDRKLLGGKGMGLAEMVSIFKHCSGASGIELVTI